MWVEIPSLAVRKCDVETIVPILLEKCEPALQLNAKDLAGDVESDEICTLPIISQSEGDKPVVSEDRRDLLEVEVLQLKIPKSKEVDLF